MTMSDEKNSVIESEDIDMCDFFFGDVTCDVLLPDSIVTLKSAPKRAPTKHVTTSSTTTRSAPTLRKYTSCDDRYGFNMNSDMISFMSLTPSLSHPGSGSSKRPLPSEVSDFIDIVTPPVIEFSDLKDMERQSIGRNSLIYKAKYRSETVAVKMMIPGLQQSAAVQAEFDMEQYLLSTLRHPNIVRLLGCGQVDPLSKPGDTQRFTVLEWLEHSLEDKPPTKSQNVVRRAFESSACCFPAVLPVLLQVSSVLRYLHCEVPHSAALEAAGGGRLEIIHRAVVPEHFRFSDDPVQSGLKLTSFMACHLTFHPHQGEGGKSRRRSRRNDGGTRRRLDLCAAPHHPTTSICYTPPEVALRLSVSTKSDIYAFSLLAWQLMKNKKPYSGLSKSDFMNRVVYKGRRPKLSRSWSESFSSILQACWLNDPVDRPHMHTVFENLILFCRQINVTCAFQT